ncbi:hypothetical protein LEP1GSC052_2061 [Leptospira kmetyi serovar Malaysia str. Bejo-Iso9]|nr:hypothetical protein LEP1GSC052_2061 [Leptospira kmetyi serovar Malaysia str. Bejo-Iso9]
MISPGRIRIPAFLKNFRNKFPKTIQGFKINIRILHYVYFHQKKSLHSSNQQHNFPTQKFKNNNYNSLNKNSSQNLFN